MEENGVVENGVGFNINNNNKYRRMDEADLEEIDIVSEYEAQILRRSTTKKFVMASAVFASLNSVLLGYCISLILIC